MIDTDHTQARLERWLEVSERSEQVAARVLASAISVTPRALVDVVASAYGGTWEDGQRATARLLRRPFVEHLEDGYRISEPFASRLRVEFKTEDRYSYERVNGALIDAETENLEAAESADEAWFTRGRIAFYLAAIDPDQSARTFIDTFAHPPAGNPGPPRSWLAELVARQREQLAGQERTVLFFAAFKAYTDGRFVEAKDAFAKVLASEDRDAVRAISLHLWAVTSPRDNLAEESLREAIALSHDLGLVENEVMATNTLVYRLVAEAERATDGVARIHEAASLAEANSRLAEESGDRYLRIWCSAAFARARWLDVSDFGREADSVANSVVTSIQQLLANVERQAEGVGDIDSAVEAANARASIYRDRGEYAAAIRILETAFNQWRDVQPTQSAKKWAKTAGSMRQAPMSPSSRKKLVRLRNNLDRWLSRNPSTT